jgi:hypothetical protein
MAIIKGYNVTTPNVFMGSLSPKKPLKRLIICWGF